jgi:hypothetical protein
LEIKMTVTLEDVGRRAFELLGPYLQKIGWKGERIKGRHAYSVDIRNELFPIRLFLEIDIDLTQFRFSIIPDVKISDDKLSAVAEYFCRVNWGMRIGNFDLDFRSGKISFRNGIEFRGTTLSMALIDGAIEPALHAFEEFRPGLMNVIAGLEEPADAVFD